MAKKATALFSPITAARTFSSISRLSSTLECAALNEGDKLTYDEVADRKSGKTSAGNLQAA